MKAKLYFVTFCLLLYCNSSNAGFFGPNQDDAKAVTVKSVNSKCPMGKYAFEVRNSSKYKVTQVSFFVRGEIPGRSTKYNLSDPLFSDYILTPYAHTIICTGLNQEEWPDGEKLTISAVVLIIAFEDKGKRVNIVPE